MRAAGRVSAWRKLPLALTELCIDTTLQCGQSFRWRKVEDEWICALRGRVVVLKQDKTHLHYKSIFPGVPNKSHREADDTEQMLLHYFNLKHDLGALYEQWSHADPIFKNLAPRFAGVRVLNQDAFEALICFICSSNNNIVRISSMAHKICQHYGAFIAKVGDEEYHDFPTPQALTDPKVEPHLRELGFGYRAQYIAHTAKTITGKPAGWLNGLRNPDSPVWGWKRSESDKEVAYKEAHEELVTLSGVGPKVADCVCLMGLGWSEAVPIDTHFWQIAQRDYNFGKTKTKTFTKATYDAVGDHFRQLWGKQAGWAHSVLFTADLKSFAKAKKTAAKEAATSPSETKSITKGEKERHEEEEVEEEEEEKTKADPGVKFQDKAEQETGSETPNRESKRKRRPTVAVKVEESAAATHEYPIHNRSQKRTRG